MFTALAACDPKGVIGNNGTLPWHCPEDLKHFRNTTLTHVMIMGYRTFLSMPPRAFEERTSIVFSRKHPIDPTKATQVTSLEELAQFYSQNKHLLAKTQFVIGGAEIFDLFFKHSLIERAILSHLHQPYAGDTFFPMHHLTGWRKELIEEKSEFSVIEYKKS